MYDPTNEEDDMVEMEEERLRMREHVMNEVRNFSLSSFKSLNRWITHLLNLRSQVDTNKDRLVSLQEFLVATNKKEFLEPDSWEVSWDGLVASKAKIFSFPQRLYLIPSCLTLLPARQTLEQNQAYTEEEMREFEEHLAQQEQDLNMKAVDLQKQREELERQQEQLNAQKLELQQVLSAILKILVTSFAFF